MGNEKYSLDDLSRETGIEPRTIRSYIQQGLLRGPEAMGRAAYYVDHHLKRLQVVKLLKDFYGLQLKDIRSLLLKVGDGELDPDKLDPELLAGRESAVKRTSALDFVREARQELLQSRDELDVTAMYEDRCVAERWEKSDCLPSPAYRQRAGAEPAIPDEMAGSPLADLLGTLRDALGADRVARKSRGEMHTHIEVTPEIELVIRGALDVKQLALLEQIADHMRAFLTGGSGHEREE